MCYRARKLLDIVRRIAYAEHSNPVHLRPPAVTLHPPTASLIDRLSQRRHHTVDRATVAGAAIAPWCNGRARQPERWKIRFKPERAAKDMPRPLSSFGPRLPQPLHAEGLYYVHVDYRLLTN